MNLDKTLWWIIVVGLFSILFTPLLSSGALFFPFITTKAFFFRIIVEIIFAIWIFLVLRNEKYRPSLSWVLGSAICFLFIVSIANLFGTDPYFSFWSNFERMDGFVNLLHIFAFFVTLISVFRGTNMWRNFWHTSIGVSTLVTIHAFVQLMGGAEIHQGSIRLDANLGNATYLAVYLLIHIFLLFYFAIKSKSLRWVFICLSILQIIALYYTQTRGALLGLLAGVFVTFVLIGIFNREGNWKRWRAVSISVVLGVLILISGFIAIKDTNFVQSSSTLSRFANISFNDKSQARQYLWPMALEAFSERPILGYGQGNFIDIFAKKYIPEMHHHEPWFDSSHNILLDWLVAAGIFGLLSYLSLFVVPLYFVWKNNFPVSEKSVLSGLFVAYLVNNLFVFDNLVSYILFFSLLAFLSFKIFNHKKPVFEGRVLRSGFSQGICAAVIIFLFFTTIFLVTIKPLRANLLLIDGFKTNLSAEIRNNAFVESFALNTLGNREISEQYAMQVFSLLRSPELSDQQKQDYLISTSEVLEEEISRDPDDARIRFVAGTFYLRIGMSQKAVDHLERARDIAPNKLHTLVQLSLAYLQNGQNEDSLELISQTYETAPEFLDASRFYMVIALELGENDTVISLLEDHRPDLFATNQILKLMTENDLYDQIETIILSQIEKDPDNLQLQFSLAANYLQSGQRLESIQVLEDVSDNYPEASSQADFYISEIRAGRNPIEE